MGFGEGKMRPDHFLKVRELKPEMENFNIILKFEEKLEPREVVSKKDGKIHMLTDALCGDETGAALAGIWAEKAEEIEEGKYYAIAGCRARQFSGKLRLEIGWQAAIKPIEAKFEVNTANNRSV